MRTTLTGMAVGMWMSCASLCTYIPLLTSASAAPPPPPLCLRVALSASTTDAANSIGDITRPGVPALLLPTLPDRLWAADATFDAAALPALTLNTGVLRFMGLLSPDVDRLSSEHLRQHGGWRFIGAGWGWRGETAPAS